MFTGIIEEVGVVTDWSRTADAARVTVRAPRAGTTPIFTISSNTSRLISVIPMPIPAIWHQPPVTLRVENEI